MKKIIPYLRATGYRELRNIVPPVFITLTISIMELLNLGLIYPIIQFFVDKKGFSEGGIIAFIRKIIPDINVTSASISLLIIFFSITIFRGTFSYFGYQYIFNKISNDEAQFSSKEFQKLLNKEYLYFVSTPSIQIVRDIAIAIPQGFSATLQSIFLLATEIVVILGMVTMLILANYQMFLLLVIFFGIAGLVYVKFISPLVVEMGIKRHDNSHKCIGIIQQSLEGIQQIKNTCSERYFLDLFTSARVVQAQVTSKLQLYQNIPKIYFETLLIICICLFLGYTLLNSTKEVDTSIMVTIGFFTVAALRLLPSILRISTQYNNILSYKESIAAVIRLASQEILYIAKVQPEFSFKHTLELQNISFKYEKDLVLKNIDLSIEKNACIGIIGKSGQGKTTLINILVSLLEPNAGRVIIDQDAIPKKHVRDYLKQMVAYVPQNIFLLDASLAENVAFGQKLEDIDFENVKRVLKLANLEEFIDKELSGENIQIGERGVRISGGQRQRIGIARALYFNRDIIIFDEATSSLDDETESNICKTIKSLKKAKTIIIVSHRKKPISIADKVYEMKTGSLREV